MAGSCVACGAYNVCDDEPATREDVVRAIFDAFAIQRRPRRMPDWLQKLAVGRAGETLLRSQRVSNAKFKNQTGWSPAYVNVRSGWQATAARIG